jgi:hypothetical protein
MHSKYFHRRGCAQLIACAVLALPGVRAEETPDTFPSFESYIKISGHAASISGNEAAFQKRLQQPKSGGAGIEELHYTKQFDRKTSLVFDGRALVGSEDYLAKLNLAKVEFATFDVGYKRFRTFYDGIGGFFPVNQTWRTLNPEDLHLDRGAFWAEVQLAVPQTPVFTVRYTNETRNGQKDSTSWGETDNVGQPYRTLNGGLEGSNNNATVRKITPSYLQIDERHEALEGSVKQTVGATTYQLTVLRDWSDKKNGRFVTRFPGEQLLVTPAYVAITPAVGTAASQWATFQNQVQQSTYDNQDTGTTSLTGTSVTTLSPKLTVRASANYQNVSSDFSGDRIIVTNTPTGPGFVGGLPVTTTYNTRNLAGNAKVRAYSGNIGLEFKPSQNLATTLSLRGEDKSARSRGSFNVVAAPNANLDLGGGVKPPTGTTVPITTTVLESSAIDEKALIPVLDLRYTGFKNLALYASITRKIGDGTESNTPPYNPAVDPRVAIAATPTAPAVPANPINQIISPTRFYADVARDSGDYTIGGNWHGSAALSLRLDAFYKKHTYHATGYNTNPIIAGVVPAAAPTLDNNYELDSQFWGTKLTALAKPSDRLSFTTRYIWQKGKMQVTGYLPTFPANDSMDSTNHMIDETIDWTPASWFYLQANASLVFNVISTAYPRGGSIAAPGVIPANRILQNSNNNYTTGSVLAGAVLTKTDDVQVQCTSYRARNFNPQLALYTQPYGASANDIVVTVGLKHKFSDKWLGTAKLGYFNSKNDTTGGFTNFRGPLAYFAFEHAL